MSMQDYLKVAGAGVVLGGAGAAAGYFAGNDLAEKNAEDIKRFGPTAGAVTGGILGAVAGVVGMLMWQNQSATPAMGDAKVDAIWLKLVQAAEKALWHTMGRPGDVPWWLEGIEIKQDRDGKYYLLAKISEKLPMDDTGWPYGLPHDQDGIQVRSSRANPLWHQPGQAI
jgi:hypothetical protein